MPLTALALVLASAAMHATWNLVVKRLGGTMAGPALTWSLGVASAVLLLPVAGWMLASGAHPLDARDAAWLVGGAALHVAYFLLLLRAYRVADLSVVYPVARGSGPLVALAVAVALFGEPTTPGVIGGALLVAVGIATLATGGGAAAAGDLAGALADRARLRRGVTQGLVVGLTIGTYTLYDRHLVGPLGVAPLLVEWTSAVLMAAMVTPLAWRDRASIARGWRAHALLLLGVGALSSASYILFLTALGLAGVGRVAPARETSILFGVLLGARVLGEGAWRRRLAGAAAMTAGVALLALG